MVIEKPYISKPYTEVLLLLEVDHFPYVNFFSGQSDMNAPVVNKEHIQATNNSSQQKYELWKTVHNKKRNRNNSKNTENRKQPKTGNYWLSKSVPISNRYERPYQGNNDKITEKNSQTTSYIRHKDC